ncbi:MAG: hypothetical protein COA43_07775 [Robiginitomaculum sp.]|nr:MAG: hypothetical protein COA43_07775 [Robiginitomaculum sp.]
MVYRNFNTKINFAFGLLSLVLFAFISVRSLGVVTVSFSVNNFDKVLHMTAYFVLGLCVFPALYKVRLWMVWALLCLFGVVIECLQGAMSIGRKADFWDAVANASGALLAGLFWLALSVTVLRLKRANSPKS